MTTPISQVSQASDLEKAIVRNVGTNRDGKLSTDEFGAVLTKLVAGIRTSDNSASATASDTPQPPNAQSPIGKVPVPPLVQPPVYRVPVPPLVQPPIDKVPVPPLVQPPIDKVPVPPLVQPPIDKVPVPPLVQPPVDRVPVPPLVQPPIDKVPVPPLVQPPIDKVPVPPLVQPPVDKVPVPPLVQPPIGGDPSTPPVSSSPADDSNQAIDISGPYFTNMPMLPSPPGLDTEPQVPGGIVGGSGFGGSDTPVQSRRVVFPSSVSLPPDVQSPIGVVRSRSLKRLARAS